MDVKINKLVCSFFIGLIILPFAISVYANTTTSVNPVNYGGTYKVKPGDIVQYNTTKFLNPTNEASIIAYNNSPILYNTSIGTITTITIQNITLVDNFSQVFSEVNVVNSRTHLNMEVLTNQTNLLVAGFNTKNDFIQYINADHRLNIPANGYNQTVMTSQINGDFYNEVIKITSSYPALTIIVNETINWKTGWVQSFDRKQFASDGTLYSETKQVLLANTTNSNQSILSYTNLAILIGLALISGGIIITFVSFVVYIRSPEKKSNNISFNKYLKEKIRKEQPKKRISSDLTDKALEMIEDIIKESQE